jgi:hypothetical protein
MLDPEVPLAATPKRFQWKISTWLVLMAILGWALAIWPPMIEETTKSTLPNGTRHIHVEIWPNPHYLGPFIALYLFAAAKDVAAWRAKRALSGTDKRP